MVENARKIMQKTYNNARGKNNVRLKNRWCYMKKENSSNKGWGNKQSVYSKVRQSSGIRNK